MRREARPRRKLELYCACGANQRVDAWQLSEGEKSRLRVRFYERHAGPGHDGDVSRREWEELRAAVMVEESEGEGVEQGALL